MSLQRCQNCNRLTMATFCSMCQAGMGQRDQVLLMALSAEERRLGYEEAVEKAKAKDYDDMVEKLIGERPSSWTQEREDAARPEREAAAAMIAGQRLPDPSRGGYLPPRVAEQVEAQSRPPRRDFWSWLREKSRLRAQIGPP